MTKVKSISKEEFEKTAVRVSKVSIIANLVLSLLKMVAGIVAHSGAMVSDAVHSMSDVVSSIVVIVGVKLSAKESDADHQYGHERIEPVAQIILSVLLLVTALFLGKEAIDNLISKKPADFVVPGVLALVAAIVSILSKEAMYWYTRHYARLINSGALMADAWHHRSDAISSIGALVGIVGAMAGIYWFDAAASIIICGFIIKVSFNIFIDAINKMVDHAASKEFQRQVVKLAGKQEGVLGVSRILTRVFGNKIYVDLHVLADGNISLIESDKIAGRVHQSIEDAFPDVKHIAVIVKPKFNKNP